MAVYGGGQQCPKPSNQNACDCGKDNGMMRTVGGRDTRMIETVATVGDVGDI